MRNIWKARIILIAVLTVAPSLAEANSGDFNGGVTIGSSYAAVDTAPTNGMIVQGEVGIGTSSPGASLDVEGTGKVFLNSGAVDIGTTSPSSSGGLINVAWNPCCVNATFYLASGSSYSGSPIVFFNSSGGAVGYISQSNTSVSYVNASDRRLKGNIKPTTRGLDALMRIVIQDYNFIAGPEEARSQGFIAQDLYKVYPEAVAVGGDDLKTHPWGVDYGRITPLIIRAVQQIKEMVDGSNEQIKMLRAENEKLTAQVNKQEREIAALRK